MNVVNTAGDNHAKSGRLGDTPAKAIRPCTAGGATKKRANLVSAEAVCLHLAEFRCIRRYGRGHSGDNALIKKGPLAPAL